jgi:lysine/ornithine N-monooxygenase
LANGDQIDAHNVVLAMGLSEHPFWPEWALEAKANGARVTHIFDKPEPDLTQLQEPIAVIGGGISAAHLIKRLAHLYPGQVTMLTRHKLRMHPFDSDPAWLGSKNMRWYSSIQDYTQRRRIISEARHRGSIPRELYYDLQKLVNQGLLSLVSDEIGNIQLSSEEMEITRTTHDPIKAGAVLLATGFHSTPPGIEWLQTTVDQTGLRCAQCGYPIVSSQHLEWAPRLFVMGALAELEIGPVSRNIAGARRAAEKIASITG